MDTLVIAGLSFIGFFIAYRTYGRWLGQKVFRLAASNITPANELRDGVDYEPARKSILFGHHFTSIAGTGPIVGPAIAVFYGWLPALLWVVFGSIFIGAVHDFGSLVVSLRHKGKSLGEIAGDLISPRARILLLFLLLLEVTIVLAIFGLVIAVIFQAYPGGIVAVWISLPLAILIGLWARKPNRHILLPSLLVVGLIYATIALCESQSLNIVTLLGLDHIDNPVIKPYITEVTVWTAILFIYCFIASVLPVWLLLQPRDYINSQQLFVAMGILIVGLVIAGVTGQASMSDSAPAVASASEIPADAPPMWPFLFITIACGAVSGFHSMVSSGTSSKQLSSEPHARLIGYGSMLTEGALAVLVILACCAGVGMGVWDKASPPVSPATVAKTTDAPRGKYVQKTDAAGQPLLGQAAWRTHYSLPKQIQVTEKGKDVTKTVGGWKGMRLGQKVGAFIEGGANFIHAAGLPIEFAIGMLGVMVACFAATTLDSATRLQRYVIQELGHSLRLKPLTNKYLATALAVGGGFALAIFAGDTPGAGGRILWPMFGATNQVLAGLGFVIIAMYLLRHKRPVWFLTVPAVLMLVLPAWAMSLNMIDWFNAQKWLLFGFGAGIQLLTAWLILEAVIAYHIFRRRQTDAEPLREAA